MNIYQRPSHPSAVRWWVAFPIVTMLLVAGCESSTNGPGPSPESQLHIENVAKWYQQYRARNANKYPPNEEAFVAFIQRELQSRGDTFDDEMITSPRDGQKYVVRYGKPISTDLERNVVVYEQEGYRGKKLLAFEMGYSQEVDDAELESLLAGK